MHITASCPSCGSRYQLDPTMRGRQMRCPNPVCREVFEVKEIEPSAVPPAPIEASAPPSDGTEPTAATRPQQVAEPMSGSVQSVGSVGDLVPILDAEVVHEVPPPTPLHAEIEDDAQPIPVEGSLLSLPIEVDRLVPLEPDEEERAGPRHDAPSWHVPPPIRNAQAQPAPSPEPAEPPRARSTPSTPKPRTRLPAKLPEEAPPTWHSPPPIRRPTGPALAESAPPAPPAPPEMDERAPVSPEPSYEPRRPSSGASRRALWIIGVMIVVGGFVIATVTILALNAYVLTEERQYAQAKKEYEEGKYAGATGAFRNLIKDFPRSDNLAHYQILAELSEVRDQVYSAQADPREAPATLQRFLSEHQGDPLLKAYRPDIGETLGKLAEQLASAAEQLHDRALLGKAKEAALQSERFPVPDPGRRHPVTERIAKAEASITRWWKKQDLLAHLGQMLATRTPVEALREARSLAKREGLEQDREVTDYLNRMVSAARQRVRYVAQTQDTSTVPAEPVETSLLVVPPVLPVSRTTKPTTERKRPVLALARGVLYALDPDTGQEWWATRVGIDTTGLPVRLPATEALPELLLVLSADRSTIMALEPRDGSVFWQHRLTAPCLGRPVVVGRRVFVPTYDDGRVYEIERVTGHILGYFELGQKLSVGGAWQEGTDLLFFPGDSDYLYVLDAALTQPPNQPPRSKQCVAMLHTGHPSGSLRGEPIVINRTDPFAKAAGAALVPSYLILTQLDDLDHIKLRVFGLPIENTEAAPLLPQEPRIRGWSWLRPYYDSERLAFATDAGRFELFGINQVGNDDAPLFRQLRTERVEAKAAQAKAPLGRAQVVHVKENDFWVAQANGELQRFHSHIFRGDLVPVWETPRALGSPMHAAQLDENEKTIFLVTQDLTRQIYLATALAAEDGKIKWQRQLGLECQTDPLVLGREVIAVDRGGGLFVFDGSKYRHQEEKVWRTLDPRWAAPLPAGPVTVYLLPGADGNSVYEVAAPTTGKLLSVRQYQPGRAGDKAIEEMRTANGKLPPLAGTPAIVGRNLVVPLANGTIRRFALPLSDGLGESGPDWRARRADEGAPGHIVALGADDFLTTDGSRGLTHWQWPQESPDFSRVPRDKTPTVELPARIVTAPLVVPATAAGSDWLVYVADSSGALTVLHGPDLKPEGPPLQLHGKQITAGPFRRGAYVGCIVDGRRLVWLDAAKGAFLWEYTTSGEGIVGQPQLVGDLLIIADASGLIVGLDPANGKKLGKGYALKANAAPAATPVAFSPETAFVPLTDGTVFLLGLRHLRDPLAVAPPPSEPLTGRLP